MLGGEGDIQQDQGTGENFVYTSDSVGNNETMPMLLTCYKKEKQL